MENLYSKIINTESLLQSAKQVKKNSCTAMGVDAIPCKLAVDYLQEHLEEIRKELINGVYSPLPIKRIRIPKPNGNFRYIGIPTVIDKIVQQAILQTLVPIYEKIFNPCNYGFRPDRNTYQAIIQAKQYLNEGYTWIVQIDLNNFFDTIHHDKMMSELYKTIKDRQVLNLIRKYMQSDIIYHGEVVEKALDRGIPQGYNLSPLLANVYLHLLDTELSRSGIRFVRYADDINLFCNTIQSAKAIKNRICRFIENKLLLKVNEGKTRIVAPENCKILGFKFCRNDNQYLSCIPHKVIQKLQNEISIEIHNAPSYESTKKRVNEKLTGWYNYYRQADIFLSKRTIKKIDKQIIELLYKKSIGNLNIGEFKKLVNQDEENLSIMKLMLSDNKANC